MLFHQHLLLILLGRRPVLKPPGRRSHHRELQSAPNRDLSMTTLRGLAPSVGLWLISLSNLSSEAFIAPILSLCMLVEAFIAAILSLSARISRDNSRSRLLMSLGPRRLGRRRLPLPPSCSSCCCSSPPSSSSQTPRRGSSLQKPAIFPRASNSLDSRL